MAEGKRPAKQKKPKALSGIPDFKSYNTSQLTNPTTQILGYSKGGEAKKPNHRTHPFKRVNGQVEGGSGTQDDVPAMLVGGNKEKPGEFVMNQGAVLNMGLDRLNHENMRGLATLNRPTKANNTDNGSSVAQMAHGGEGGADVGSSVFGPNSVFPQDQPWSKPTPIPGNWGDYKQDIGQHAWATGGYNSGWNPAWSGYNSWWGPGMYQGNTMIPTHFDSQGYPWAVPVQSGDNPQVGGSRHQPQKKNQ